MERTHAQIASSVRHPARATVRVSGPLDAAGVAAIRGELAGWRDAGVLRLDVDVSDMPRCAPELTDPLAHALAWARTQLRGRGGNLTVTGVGGDRHAELTAAVAALTERPPPVGNTPS